MTQEQYQRKVEFLSRPESSIAVNKIHPYDLYDLIQAKEYIEIGRDLFLVEDRLYFQTTCVNPSPTCSLR